MFYPDMHLLYIITCINIENKTTFRRYCSKCNWAAFYYVLWVIEKETSTNGAVKVCQKFKICLKIYVHVFVMCYM